MPSASGNSFHSTWLEATLTIPRAAITATATRIAILRLSLRLQEIRELDEQLPPVPRVLFAAHELLRTVLFLDELQVALVVVEADAERRPRIQDVAKQHVDIQVFLARKARQPGSRLRVLVLEDHAQRHLFRELIVPARTQDAVS